MRKVLPIVIIFVALCFTSCLENHHGYPKKINFPAEGGTIDITGDDYIVSMEITDYDGHGSDHSKPEGMENYDYDSYQWLTASSEKASYKITLTAEPNTTGRNRKLYLHLNFGPDYADILIKQNK